MQTSNPTSRKARLADRTEDRQMAKPQTPTCTGCAVCDPAIAAHEAEMEARYWADEVARWAEIDAAEAAKEA